MDYPRAAQREGQDPLRGAGTDPLTTTEAAILGLLGDGEHSGYDLIRHVETSVGMFWAPARSGIYAVLPRLVEKGFATRREVAQERRPDKQLYRSTEDGRLALRRWIEAGPTEPDPAYNPLLLRVYFGAETEPAVVAGHVEARKREAEERLAVIGAIRADLVQGDPDTDRVYRRFVADWGLEYYAAVVRWADATLAELRGLDA